MSKPKLENWWVGADSDPYLAPELRVSRLYGRVYNHPKAMEKWDCADGESIRTSQLVMLDSVGKKARTKNTEYELGEPAPHWVSWLKAQGYDLDKYNFGGGSAQAGPDA